MRCSKEGASGPLCGTCIWGSFLVGDFGHLAEAQTSSKEGLAARGSPQQSRLTVTGQGSRFTHPSVPPAVQTHGQWPRTQIYPLSPRALSAGVKIKDSGTNPSQKLSSGETRLGRLKAGGVRQWNGL